MESTYDHINSMSKLSYDQAKLICRSKIHVIKLITQVNLVIKAISNGTFQ